MDRVTKPQKKMLISMLKETKYMEGKKEKEWYWEKIQAALNMIGPKKTIIQWKKCWRDMRLTTRKKLAEIKRCQISGGSPPPGVELTHEDNDIIDIVGAEYFYEEINGDVKPTEHFLTGFEYVPEQFCDAILSGSKEAPGGSHDTIDGEGERRSASTSHATADTRTPPLIGFASTSNNASSHSSAAAAVHHQLKRNREEFAEHRESHFDDKLIRLLHETFAIKRERRLRNRDPDKLFLLSLADEFKKIPDIFKLDVKTELIQVLNKWQKKSEKTRNGQKQQQDTKQQTAGNPRLAMPTEQHTSMPAPHAQHLQHNLYQFQKYENDKNVKPDQPPNEKQSMHPTQSQPAQNRDAGDAQHMNSQQVQHQQSQMSHNMYQLQKKYDDNTDKGSVPLQNSKDQHKQHVEHHQQHQHPHHHPTEQQHPPSPSATTLLQHPHPHSVMFPIQAIRNEQQSQHPHSQHSQQHHPPPLFNNNPSTMTNNSM